MMIEYSYLRGFNIDIALLGYNIKLRDYIPPVWASIIGGIYGVTGVIGSLAFWPVYLFPSSRLYGEPPLLFILLAIAPGVLIAALALGVAVLCEYYKLRSSLTIKKTRKKTITIDLDDEDGWEKARKEVEDAARAAGSGGRDEGV